MNTYAKNIPHHFFKFLILNDHPCPLIPWTKLMGELRVPHQLSGNEETRGRFSAKYSEQAVLVVHTDEMCQRGLVVPSIRHHHDNVILLFQFAATRGEQLHVWSCRNAQPCT